MKIINLLCVMLFCVSTYANDNNIEVVKVYDTIYNPYAKKDKYKYILLEEYQVNTSTNLKDGFYKKFNHSNQITETGFYKDGLKDSIWQENLTEENKAIGTYLLGEKNGIWRYYDKNEDLIERITYSNGIKDGMYVNYFNEEQPHYLGNFKQGKQDNYWIYYFPNKKRRAIILYKNGEQIDTAFALNIFNDTTYMQIKMDSTIEQFYYNSLDRYLEEYKLSNKYNDSVIEINYYPNHQIKSKIEYEIIKEDKYNSRMQIYDILFLRLNGDTLDIGTYKNGTGKLNFYDGDTLYLTREYKHYLFDGLSTYFYSNGNIKRIEKYNYGEYLKEYTEYYDEQGNPLDSDYNINYNNKYKQANYSNNYNIYDIYMKEEVQPSYIGGPTALMQYLSKNINYPLMARENDIEGKVYIKFYINTFGEVKEAEVIKNSANNACGEEALRVVNTMPKWNIGYSYNFPVKVYYTLPITFKLQ